MAPRPNDKDSRANKKVTLVNSKTSSTSSENNGTVNDKVAKILKNAGKEMKKGTVEVEKKTSTRSSGKVAKAEDWKADKEWHAELLKQLQGHFGKGPMRKYVDSMRKRSIFFDYEEKLLQEVLAKYPNNKNDGRTNRPPNYPMAIAIVFMKQRKDHMDGFMNDEIKLDFTDKQIRDKLDHMWKEKMNRENRNQQPTSTARLERELAVEMPEENDENDAPAASTDTSIGFEDNMSMREESFNDEAMEVEEGEDPIDNNDAIGMEVDNAEPMEVEERNAEMSFNQAKETEVENVKPMEVNTSNAKNCDKQDEKLKTVIDQLQIRFEQWKQDKEKTWEANQKTKVNTRRKQMEFEKVEEFLQGDWISANSATELLGRIHQHFSRFSDTERNELLAILEDLKLCCGNHQFTTRQTLKCNGSKNCRIQPLQQYETFESEEQIFNFCLAHTQKCESQRKLKSVDSSSVTRKFCNVENLEICETCGEYYHDSCRKAGFLEERNCGCGEQDEEFVSPSELPETNESRFIQGEVKKYGILVRCFSTKPLTEELEGDDEEEENVKKMRRIIVDFFSKHGKTLSLSYENKFILAFKKVKKNFILFFAMMAREYGSDAPPSKAGQISLDYVDSVQFLEKSERSVVYYKILNSYMEFSKRRGFSTTTFWACPPSEGEQYLFSSRPMQQYSINLSQLTRFYEKMIEAAGNTIIGVEYGIPETGLPPTGIIENAISNNSRSFTILSQTIQKANKAPNAEFEKILLAVAKKEGGEDIFNLRLQLPTNKIVANDPKNITKIAESSEHFKEIQENENMEFGVKSLNVFSTSKMVKHLLNSLEKKN